MLSMHGSVGSNPAVQTISLYGGMADTLRLGRSAVTRGGSSPSTGIYKNMLL